MPTHINEAILIKLPKQSLAWNQFQCKNLKYNILNTEKPDGNQISLIKPKSV